MAFLAWRVDGGRFKTYSIDTPNEYRDNGYESLDAERTRIVDFPSDVPPDQKITQIRQNQEPGSKSESMREKQKTRNGKKE